MRTLIRQSSMRTNNMTMFTFCTPGREATKSGATSRRPAKPFRLLITWTARSRLLQLKWSHGLCSGKQDDCQMLSNACLMRPLPQPSTPYQGSSLLRINHPILHMWVKLTKNFRVGQQHFHGSKYVCKTRKVQKIQTFPFLGHKKSVWLG